MWFFLGLQILLTIYMTEGTPLPFVVSIEKETSNGYEHLCVGAIIHKRFVLTAAHCFVNINDIRMISIADENKNDNRRDVLRIVKHMKFLPLFGYDIAIVEVTMEFDFFHKHFGKLRYENVQDQDTAYLYGWGGYHRSFEIVDFKVISNDQCQEKGFRHVTNSEMCAYSREGRGACEGDSGGPLVSADHKQVIGLLSYGKTQCKPKYIFIFTSIKTLEPWIRSQISRLLRGEYKKMEIIEA